MMTARRVLVTGSAGRIGRAVVAELNRMGCTVIGFDSRPTPGVPEDQSFVASITDAAKLKEAAANVDALIHLAATPDDACFPRQAALNDGDNFLSELVPNNIVGVYQVMEAARVLGIRRVILASTGQVIYGHLKADRVPVTPESPPQPRYLYACTKVFLEALGQVYAREHELEVVAVRLGWCPRDKKQEGEIATRELFQDVYLSPDDAGRFFAAAIQTQKLPPFSIIYATSIFRHKLRYDLGSARELLHWSPRDSWPQGL